MRRMVAMTRVVRLVTMDTEPLDCYVHAPYPTLCVAPGTGTGAAGVGGTFTVTCGVGALVVPVDGSAR